MPVATSTFTSAICLYPYPQNNFFKKSLWRAKTRMTKQPLELLSALVIILLVDPVAVFSLLSSSFFCVSKKRKEKTAPGSEQMNANADGDGDNGSHLELGNSAPLHLPSQSMSQSHAQHYYGEPYAHAQSELQMDRAIGTSM